MILRRVALIQQLLSIEVHKAANPQPCRKKAYNKQSFGANPHLPYYDASSAPTRRRALCDNGGSSLAPKHCATRDPKLLAIRLQLLSCDTDPNILLVAKM